MSIFAASGGGLFPFILLEEGAQAPFSLPRSAVCCKNLFSISREIFLSFVKQDYICTVNNADMNNNHNISFNEIIRGEHYWIVEALEHGCSDPKTTADLKNQLLQKTGWTWVD
jgi:hypothetical protein